MNEARPSPAAPITVVDLGLNNLSSVVHALRRVGADVRVTADPREVADARAVVLPGVGSFADGARALRERALDEALRGHAAAGRPLLGICLGMQLLAGEGEEGGGGEGLGLVPGRVTRLRPDDPAVRVPNIGWCDVRPRPDSAPSPAGCFYFAHSFELVAEDPGDVVAEHEVGRPVAAAVRRGSVRGVQFHPEKSQDDGLAVLDAFRAEAAAA